MRAVGFGLWGWPNREPVAVGKASQSMMPAATARCDLVSGVGGSQVW